MLTHYNTPIACGTRQMTLLVVISLHPPPDLLIESTVSQMAWLAVRID